MNNLGFNIPAINGVNLRAFPVLDESMHPIFDKTDIVIGKPVEIEDIKDNDIYIVVTANKAHIKYIKVNKYSLDLISANYLEFDPLHMPKSSVVSVFKVVRRIEVNSLA